MQKVSKFISIFDATHESVRFGHGNLGLDIGLLGTVLAKHKVGLISRISNGNIIRLLSTTYEKGGEVIGLSPASNNYEHEKAFRLPHVSFPVVYSGRGALGADVSALSSSVGVLIIGSDLEPLEGILGCIGEIDIPIFVFTDEDQSHIRQNLSERYPKFARDIQIYSDVNQIARGLESGIRKTYLNKI